MIPIATVPKLSEPFADVLDDKLWVVAMSQTDEAEITTTIVDANRRGLFYDVIALRGCYGVPEVMIKGLDLIKALAILGIVTD